jgi:hypothetical protein
MQGGFNTFKTICGFRIVYDYKFVMEDYYDGGKIELITSFRIHFITS